ISFGFGSVSEGSNEDWDDMIETNIKGLLNVTRTIIPGFIERKKGHIINIGSIAGRQVYPKGTVYCATKFAVRAITQGLLMELYDTPIRVSTIDPGLVETEFSLVRFKGDEDQAKQVYTGITPLTSGDVADAVVFCASRPPHVNISEMVLLPTDQASPYHVNRQ
ncbi:SDR family NAD(P)-dependent oxidoreductase, partial [bacterium]|nr:SDR family NAD(P)-dependent oxidoreductase [bacterium]